MKSELTWVEISKDSLSNNMRQLRRLIGDDVILCPCVKANAYGHGLVDCSKIFLEAGADWLGVNALYEARALRDAGIDDPIYILGYVPLDLLEEAVGLDCRIVVYDRETVDKLGDIGRPVKVHLKVETGNNRQGVMPEDLVDFAGHIKSFENVELEGLATHFANIEDTTDHSYAEIQLERFNSGIGSLEEAGIVVPIKHCANSAATILFPKTHFQMVRTGISSYGMWPSNETYVSYLKEGADFSAELADARASFGMSAVVGGRKNQRADFSAELADDFSFELKAAFTWKTKIAQIKNILAGEYIGYGCTYKTGHDTRLAILPVGYYDGYDRGISGGHVLIHGKRASIRGRVCMNVIIVDISDIPEAKLEDEVVLMGRGGEEKISAEQFAQWAGTINYEVTTRVNERIPRIII